MDLSWLTLRDLEYLDAAEREEHFGKAAQACHVTQPALSTQIAKMEKLLNVRLFERVGRTVSATLAGKAAATAARAVLHESRRFLSLSESSATGFGGELRLGAIATLGPYALPHLLPPLRAAHPKLKLRLTEGLTDDLLEALRRGELDAVLCADTFAHAGLSVLPLFWEPFFLATPKRHPLSRREPLLTRDLDARELIVLEDGHCLRDQALGYCRQGKRHAPATVHASSLETLRQLVALGEGYTLVPALAIRSGDPLRALISHRPFPNENVGRSIVWVSRVGFPYAEDAKKLVAIWKEHLREQKVPK